MVKSSTVYKPFSGVHLVSAEVRLELKGNTIGTTIPASFRSLREALISATLLGSNIALESLSNWGKEVWIQRFPSGLPPTRNVLVDILGLWVSCPLRSCVQHSSTYLVIPLSAGRSPQVNGYRSLCGNTSSSIWVNTSPWCWKVFPLRDHSLLPCLGSRSENWFEPRNMTRDRGLLRHDHLQPPALLFLLLVLYFVHFGKC